MATIPITVEFSGGLELLFSNQRTHKLQIPAQDPSGNPANIGFLVSYLCDNLVEAKRKDLFVMDGTVRNGILVLINDSDWELEGEDRYELQGADNILFVSTLHGG
ncbi:Ubiquitin- modifier 1 [Maublancomyces gigas]|uniref:Ubiquitin-related modifier 1 n=1 Tax=Discina gigas TaxID=1032678 RepID=A0ABR3GPN1_9PEZI